MSSGQTGMDPHKIRANLTLVRRDAKTDRAHEMIAAVDLWLEQYDSLRHDLRLAQAAGDRKRIAAIERQIQSHRQNGSGVGMAQIEHEIYGENIRCQMSRFDRSDLGNRDGLDDMVQDASRDIDN